LTYGVNLPGVNTITVEIDIDVLAAPIEEEAPSGPNLEYDPDFQALERNFDQSAWPDVIEGSLALFTRTRDLRTAVWLTHALIAKQHIDGFTTGLRLVRRLVEELWDDVHPELESLDEGLPPTRTNVIASLADLEKTINPLRRMPLIETPQARFCFRDYEIANGDIQSPNAEVDSGESEGDGTSTLPMIQGALDEHGREANIVIYQQLMAARDDTKVIERVFDDAVGAGYSPDLTPLNDLLYKMTQLFVQLGGVNEADSGAEEDTQDGVDAAGTVALRASGEIHNRADAIRTLERVAKYFEENEPSSPVPLILNRASSLISKNFIEVLQDLNPDAISQIRQIVGGEHSEG
jgi:type VI secretion system protein ImpA